MSYIQAREALEWIAAEKGRSVDGNRKELITYLNDARRLFYSIFQKVRLDAHIEACFLVKEFYEPCIECNGSPATYLGITLPPEMEQVEAAWIGTTPITSYNKWMEYQDGIKGKGSSLKMIDMGNDYPLQIDWNPSKCIKPVFVPINSSDVGKEVVVNFLDSNNESRMERLRLSGSGSATTSEVRSFKRPAGIVLPPNLAGGIEVYDCIGGANLGFLHPKISIPSFRRMKVTDVCCGSTIQVRGLRRFTEIEFDWEVVETDNKLAILEALRYLAIMSVNSSDAQWIAKARMHMDNLTNYLGGDNLRDEGPTTVRHMDFLKAKLRRSGLRTRKWR